MAGRTNKRILCSCGAAVIVFLMPSTMETMSKSMAGPPCIPVDEATLAGLVRDFTGTHLDFDVAKPSANWGHYAGNVSQILGEDGAPLQVHGVSDFEIEFGSLVPGVPYAARATVLGAEISWGGSYDMPVTLKCETDTQSFEPFGPFMDPGSGTVNDDANPRHFIFSLDEVYSSETPISVTATSWKQDFTTKDFGYDSIFPSSHSGSEEDQIATLVTLPEDGTVTSITAYVYTGDGGEDIRYAIYSDNGGEPDQLIVESGEGAQDDYWSWETVNIPDTWLPAGNYWLAISTDDDDSKFRYQDGVGGETRRHSTNAVDNGFASTWGSNKATYNNRKASIYASYTADEAEYVPYLTARSGDNSPYVLVLKDGDSVPDIPGFQNQSDLAVFVQPYVNVATGKVTLRDNEAIYLFELGTTNLSSASADFQDLVIMVTLATDPVYFLTPDTVAEGLEPIGYKVKDQWLDSMGNNIAPHLYTPSLGDIRGKAGDISSGGVTSPATYYEWFRDILGTNLSTAHDLVLTDCGDGVYRYETDEFLPINGQLYGNDNGAENHNFTYAVAGIFSYDKFANQFIEFQGGDGAWLFINDKLAIDLGGAKVAVAQRVDLDRLGLVDGGTYEMKLFYANRGQSNDFMFGTNIYMTPGKVPGSTTGSFD